MARRLRLRAFYHGRRQRRCDEEGNSVTTPEISPIVEAGRLERALQTLAKREAAAVARLTAHYAARRQELLAAASPSALAALKATGVIAPQPKDQK
jgi:hypothetical protein